MRVKRYKGDEDYITFSVVTVNFRSYVSYAEALQKFVNFLDKLETPVKTDTSDLRGIRFNYENGEYIVRIDIRKDLLDLGLDENQDYSPTTKALKILHSE